MNRVVLRTAASLLLSLTLFSSARAGDIESAKQKLDRVRVDLENNSWDAIDDDIKATQEFLVGVPAAESAPVQKQLDDYKAKAAVGMKDYKIKSIVEPSTRDLNRAADDIANRPLSALDLVDKVADRIASDDAKKYVPADQLAKLAARVQSLREMAATKVAAQKFEFAAPIVKQLDDAMAAQPFKGVTDEQQLESIGRDLNSLMSRIRGAIEGIPPTDPRAKAITDKLALYNKQIETATGGVLAAQAAQQLARRWGNQQEYFTGWDKEKQSPSWAEYTTQQNEYTSNIGMTKSIELLERLNRWFQEDDVKAAATNAGSNPAIKSTLAAAHTAFDTAAAKVHTAFNNLLAEAEKVEPPKDPLDRRRADGLAEKADNWFQGTPYHDADVARAKKLATKWNAAIAGASAAQSAAAAAMVAKASADWPAIKAALSASDGFVPSKVSQFTGKTIHLTGNNRLGWDYSPGDYAFAMEINGEAVAGKFAPNVAAAVANAVKTTGEELSDESWDLFAIVEGPGKIQLRTTAEGTVRVDGRDVGTVTSEGHKTVDCAVVRIIALHAGPVAIGSDGSGLAYASGGGTWLGFFFGLFVHGAQFVLCCLAAGLIVLAGRAAPALQTTAGTTAPATNHSSMGLAGLTILALGVLWLLSKLIFGDLFPAGCLALSGLVISADWMAEKKILPASLVKSLKPLGLLVAAATVFFGFVHFFLAGWYLF